MRIQTAVAGLLAFDCPKVTDNRKPSILALNRNADVGAQTGRQNDIPPRFVAIDGENDFSDAGRMFDGYAQAHKVGSHVGYGKDAAVKDQDHLNVGRVGCWF